MPQPYDYSTTPIDPFGSAFKGMQTGMAMNQVLQQNKLRAQQIQDKERISGELADLSENFTLDKLRKFGVKNPDYLAKFQPLMKDMSAEKKAANATKVLQLDAVAKANPKRYVEMITAESKALLASDDPEQQKEGQVLSYLAESAQKNLDAGKLDLISANAGLSAMAFVGIDDYMKYTEGAARSDLMKEQKRLLERGTEAKEKSAKAALGRVANETKKLTAEAKRLANEQKGILTPTQATDYKMKLQNQYRINGGEEFRKINRGYRNIANADMTGVGGVNIIFHFMKQIDPSSVVSPGEQATAQGASGKLSSIAHLWNKWFDKGQMSKEAIEQFKSQAKKLMLNAKKDDDKLRAIITNQAKDINLDLKGVFGISDDTEKYSWTKDANKPTNNIVGGSIGTGDNLEPENKNKDRASSFLNKFGN
jgi:hypothetical protein